MTSCQLGVHLFLTPANADGSVLLAGCQTGLWHGHVTLKVRHVEMEGESGLCARARLRASHLPQKASCVISSNPLGGVKPAACSGKNTVEPA